VIRLELPDPDGELDAVRLVSDLPLPDERRAFAREESTWVLELEGLQLERLEYLLELDGGTTPDPDNPDRAPGAFGEKSVWTAEDYAPPHWLEETREAVPATVTPLPVRSRALRTTVHVGVWAPEDADPGEPLPLLAAHDGPEYDELSALTRYAAVQIADFELPRFRIALLPPGKRDEWYSASTPYARALAEEVLPAIRAAYATQGPVVGMGASLGGLAMLHAHRAHPEALGGLFLQSSSFFMPEHDEHESGFPRWTRITRFVRGVLRAPGHEHPAPTVLTCGVEEENIHNNRAMAAALERQGYPVRLVEGRDLHNYTAWRDSFEPHLTELLVRVWEGV
jgi:enterochelin esterase-like enzyme